MSTSPEDERLLDSLFAEARNEPRPADLERVEGRLRPWLASSAPCSESSQATTSSASSKWIKAGLALVGFLVLAQQFRDASPTRNSAPPRTEEKAVPTAMTAAPPPAFATVSVADLPTAEGASTARSRAPATAAPRIAPTAPPQPAVSTTIIEPVENAESEASFLRRTRAALASDPEQALRMTDEHGARYPRGVLLQERDVIAIDALARLGKTDEARAKARAFRARYPRSAHESRINAIVGTDE